MRRGILGGTFDPPHVAHLFAGEVAYQRLGLDVITFVPAGAPWQKAERDISAPEHRWNMTQLAVAGVSYFEADDREVTRDGWTYTIDTLREYPEDDLFLVVGSDAAAGIPTWHRPDDLLELAQLAVISRPGTDRSAVESALAGGFHWLGGPELDLSSTTLRNRVAAGDTIRFLVPDLVAAYIEDHGLYSSGMGTASQ